MDNKFTPELIEKAKEAKNPDELMSLAKENGIELTEESAKAYFDRLHPQTGELSDDELEMYRAAAAVAMTPADHSPDSLWAKPYYTSIAGWEQPG